MAMCNEHHKVLNEKGEGKCSVPMWADGFPAGFCDATAYGFPIPGRYSGYVGYLACPAHGGPTKEEAAAMTKEGRNDG